MAASTVVQVQGTINIVLWAGNSLYYRVPQALGAVDLGSQVDPDNLIQGPYDSQVRAAQPGLFNASAIGQITPKGQT